jgi:polysaccharide export outer membrane protein
MHMKTILPLLLTIIIAISACSGRRNLVYFSDLDLKSDKWKNITDNGEPVILKNDVLSISVNTSSSESNMIFASAQSAEMVNGVYEKQGYRVNGEGNIKFPFLGEVTLEGLTLSQAQDQLERQLINYAKHPIVNMKFMNFRVTVIGEVNHPSTFLVPNEKINLLEALGLAGDMTAYGKRENVLLIREVNNVRTMTRINLNSQDVLNSPYFYLKQNDVIYVEPDKAKSYEVSKSTKMMPFVIAGLSAIAIFGATLISR